MKQKLTRRIDENDWLAAKLVSQTVSVKSFTKEQLTYIRYEVQKMNQRKKNQ